MTSQVVTFAVFMWAKEEQYFTMLNILTKYLVTVNQRIDVLIKINWFNLKQNIKDFESHVKTSTKTVNIKQYLD